MPKIRPKSKSSPKLTQSRSCPNLISLDSSLDDNLAAKLHCYKSTQLKKRRQPQIWESDHQKPWLQKIGRFQIGFPGFVQGMDGCLDGGLPVVLYHSWWGRFVVSVVADVVFRSIYREHCRVVHRIGVAGSTLYVLNSVH